MLLNPFANGIIPTGINGAVLVGIGVYLIAVIGFAFALNHHYAKKAKKGDTP